VGPRIEFSIVLDDIHTLAAGRREAQYTEARTQVLATPGQLPRTAPARHTRQPGGPPLVLTTCFRKGATPHGEHLRVDGPHAAPLERRASHGELPRPMERQQPNSIGITATGSGVVLSRQERERPRLHRRQIGLRQSNRSCSTWPWPTLRPERASP